MNRVFIFLGIIFFTACSEEEVDSLQPQILSISPLDLDTKVALDIEVSVAFSEAIDTSTMKDNFKLFLNDVPVITELDYMSETFIATLRPVSNLAHGESYEVIINDGLTDLAGNSIMDTSWVFSTIDSSVVRYDVTFNAIWSLETHPADFPTNAHFSGLIGMTHSEDVNLYNAGTLASLGIKNMAEKGQKGSLTNEINEYISNGSGYSLISGDGISLSPEQVSTEFEIGIEHTYATITTMIAPSPDWFLAETVNLMENDLWLDSLEVNCIAYDAGTDSGITFASSDQVTDPPENIFIINESPLAVDGIVAPMGTFKFVRKQ